jgi:hypothetical protein
MGKNNGSVGGLYDRVHGRRGRAQHPRTRGT